VPGIGKKKFAAVIVKRPFKDIEAYQKVAGRSPVDAFLKF
jgi:DNA uptake protein ComE-like DNA-binding protein